MLMFPKLVLCSPPCAGRKKQYLVGPLLRDHLQQWTSGTGILVDTPSALSSFLDILQHQGPSYGLHPNLSKCEVFWPSGDQLLWVSLQLLSVWFFLKLVVLIFWALQFGVLLIFFLPLWDELWIVYLLCKRALKILRILRLNCFCCVVAWVFVSLTIF